MGATLTENQRGDLERFKRVYGSVFATVYKWKRKVAALSSSTRL
jgi:hypothetical protein